MKNKITRILSLLLVFCMTAAFFPNTVYAEGTSTQETTEPEITESEVTESAPAKSVTAADKLLTPLIIEEDETKREEYAKHFLCEDGSYIAISYSQPVHTQVDGEWVDAFLDVREEDGRFVTSSENGETSLRADVGKTDIPTAQIRADGYTLSWELDAAGVRGENVGFSENARVKLKTSAELATENKIAALKESRYDLFSATAKKEKARQIIDSGKIDFDNAEDDKNVAAFNEIADEYNRSKIFAVSEAKSVVEYKDAFGKGKDVRYTLTNGKLEEDVVLYETDGFTSYTETVVSEGLKAVLNENNSVSFVNEDGKEIFVIQSPVMYDAAEIYSDAIKVSLEYDGEKTRITYTPDSEWLNSKDRVLPVVIDPTVTTRTISQYNQIDNYVYSTQGNSVVDENSPVLKTGYDGTTQYRAYWRVNQNLPVIPTEAKISAVHFNIKATANNSGIGNLGLYEVRGTWYSNTIIWGNQPQTSRFVRSLSTIPSNKWLSYSRWTLGDIVTDMYKYGVAGYGFVLRYTGGTHYLNEFYSSDCGDVNNWPYLEIRYTETYSEIEAGNYYIKNVKTGKYLNVMNAATTSGSPVRQYHLTGNPQQIWKIKQITGEDYYNIKPQHTTGQNLYYGTDAMAEIRITDGDSKARWRFESNNAGGYYISSVYKPWTCLDVDHSSTADNAIIYIFPMHGQQNQQWILERVGNISLNQEMEITIHQNETNTFYFSPPSEGLYTFEIKFETGYYYSLNSKLYDRNDNLISDNDDFETNSLQNSKSLSTNLQAGETYHIVNTISGVASSSIKYKLIIKKRAIIIVPGFMGTELWRNGIRYWPPTQSDDTINGLLNSVSNSDFLDILLTLFQNGNSISDRISELIIPDNSNYDTYNDGILPLNIDLKYLLNQENRLQNIGTLDHYYNLSNDIYSNFSSKYNVEFYGYDWRLSNTVSAEKLNSFIVDKDFTNVVFISHSNGGLVVSHAIRLSEDYIADKSFFIGTPFSGSAMIIPAISNKSPLVYASLIGSYLDPNSLIYNFIVDALDLLRTNISNIFDNLNEALLSFPSSYELIPSERYFVIRSYAGYNNYNYRYYLANNNGVCENYYSSITLLANTIDGWRNDLFYGSNGAEAKNNLLWTANGHVSSIFSDSYYIFGNLYNTLWRYNKTSDQMDFDAVGDGVVSFWSAIVDNTTSNKLYVGQKHHVNGLLYDLQIYQFIRNKITD